jgi:alcohol dehydrogenase (NADP+)
MNKRLDDATPPPAAVQGRRDVLIGGAALLTAPLVGGLAPRADGAPTRPADAHGPFPTRAYGVSSASSPVRPFQIERRALGPRDVLLDVLNSGICHSDIHPPAANGARARIPAFPGHENICRVQAVGSAVTKFKVGDIGGVGCMVDSFGTCENCLADREQNCLNGTTFTYDSKDRVTGGNTYGGYSDKMVVSDRFVIRIPPGADLPATARLLCAGVTTFSPMQHWKVTRGQRVGVIGLGGLGHMAVKLAVARKADVTVFTTSPGKLTDARRLGASEAVLWSDAAAMKRLANSFDLMIATVPRAFPMQPFMDLLKLDATLVFVGALDQLQGLNGMSLGFGRKSLAGSMIGGVAETQEVIDYCAARNIKAEIELIRPEEINRAWERVVGKDVRYRFVIDIASGKEA